MLNLSFFITAFTSISWFIYCLRYLNFQNASTESLYYGLVVTFLPMALIWGIFAAIKNYYTERRTAHYIYSLLDVVKKNTDKINAMETSLINREKEQQNTVTLQYFNLLISDINEILSDIIKRSNSVSSAQLEHLWTQTAGGERWIMAKTFIEITNYQSFFSEHLHEKALKDVLLKGSILEFNSRYKTIHSLLQNDTDKILLNMIEYGALGKVYEILTPIAEKLANSAEYSAKASQPVQAPTPAVYAQSPSTENSLEFPSFLSQKEDKTPTLSEPIHEVQNNNATEIEAGLHAIREEILSKPKEEPKQDIPAAPIISGFSQTQMALRDIKNSSPKEAPTEAAAPKRKTPVISLEELEKEIESSPENNYDEYAYPFGAWLNAKNKN